MCQTLHVCSARLNFVIDVSGANRSFTASLLETINDSKDTEMLYRPSVGAGAAGAKAPVNFGQQVPGTRPENPKLRPFT